MSDKMDAPISATSSFLMPNVQYSYTPPFKLVNFWLMVTMMCINVIN